MNDEARLATFNSRVFTVPVEDAANVFVWRQRDWERNSLQMYARSIYTHAELQGQSHSQIHELLHARGHNWGELPARPKSGTFVLPLGGAVTEHARVSPSSSRSRGWVRATDRPPEGA